MTEQQIILLSVAIILAINNMVGASFAIARLNEGRRAQKNIMLGDIVFLLRSHAILSVEYKSFEINDMSEDVMNELIRTAEKRVRAQNRILSGILVSILMAIVSGIIISLHVLR